MSEVLYTSARIAEFDYNFSLPFTSLPAQVKESPPALLAYKDGNSMKEVTAAFIIEDNKVLIAQRAPGDRLAGKWEFPGGKVEPGETLEACLKREIREELELEIEVLEFVAESIYKYDTGTIKLMAFRCRRISGEIVLKVHSQVAWAKYEELRSYDLAPADIPLAEKLRPLLS